MSATRDRPMNGDEVAHAIHRTTERHVSKLEEVRLLLENTALEVAVGGSPNEREVHDSPVRGKTRLSISDRRVTGNDGLTLTAAAAALLVVPELPGRLGGSIVNSGANPVTLYLSAPGRAQTGVGALWLAANGGSWDFRLGNVLWCGPVSAISALGTTLVFAQV